MDNSIKRTNVAINIRNLRRKHNMTQEAAADKLGIKRNTYARYETDTVPPLNVLTKICELFSVTTDEILRPSTDYMSKIQNRPQSNITFSAYHEFKTHQNGTSQNPDAAPSRTVSDPIDFLNITDDEISMLEWYRSLPDDQKDAVKKLLGIN